MTRFISYHIFYNKNYELQQHIDNATPEMDKKYIELIWNCASNIQQLRA